MTPSYGTIRTAIERARIPVFPIIGRAAGIFSIPISNLRPCSPMSPPVARWAYKGVVFRLSDADGRYDEPRMRALVEAAGSHVDDLASRLRHDARYRGKR